MYNYCICSNKNGKNRLNGVFTIYGIMRCRNEIITDH